MNTVAGAWTHAALAPLAAAPVHVRSVRADDAPLLAGFVRGLSAASRYARFHAGIRELSARELDRITHFDRRVELALLAVELGDQGREIVLGEARYAPFADDPGQREFGIAVADEVRGRGIGTRLLRALIAHAERAGAFALVGDLVRDNLPMLGLAHKLGFELQRHPDDARLQRVHKRLGPHWRM
jgi:acetyltransferase